MSYIDDYPTQFNFTKRVKSRVRAVQRAYPWQTYANTYYDHPPGLTATTSVSAWTSGVAGATRPRLTPATAASGSLKSLGMRFSRSCSGPIMAPISTGLSGRGVCGGAQRPAGRDGRAHLRDRPTQIPATTAISTARS